MTWWSDCSGSLRHTWPLSICKKGDNVNVDDWPPPWPKISEVDNGYERPPLMVGPSLDFGIGNPVTISPDGSRARMHIPPVPQRPHRPARSRSGSNSSLKTLTTKISHSPPRAVLKKRKPSNGRPTISAPSDFRKVTGASEAMIPTRIISTAPRTQVRMPVSKFSHRRPMSFHPLELSFYIPGNELPALPTFSRAPSMMSRASHLSRFTAMRPRTLSTPIMPAVSRSTTRSTRRRPALTAPKMPFSRRSSVSSYTSFASDLESEIDPDFYVPAQGQRRTRSHSFFAHQSTRVVVSNLEDLPPMPQGTHSSRVSNELVSPESPSARISAFRPPSLKLDDLPSAFSSPANSPTFEKAWQSPASHFKIPTIPTRVRPFMASTQIHSNKPATTTTTAQRNLAAPAAGRPQSHSGPQSRPRTRSSSHSHSPSAGSTASTTATTNTAVTNISNSWGSNLTATASAPISPMLTATKHIVAPQTAQLKPVLAITTTPATPKSAPITVRGFTPTLRASPSPVPKFAGRPLSSNEGGVPQSPLSASASSGLAMPPLSVPSTKAPTNSDGRVWREIVWDAQQEQIRRARMGRVLEVEEDQWEDMEPSHASSFPKFLHHEDRGESTESMEVPVGLALGGEVEDDVHMHAQEDWGKGLGVEFGIAY